MGQETVRIILTKHFETRFLERSGFLDRNGEILPMMKQSRCATVSGSLVRAQKPGTYYLDVEGAGRFVLKKSGSDYIGITVLPSRHRRTLHGGSSYV